MVGTLEMMRAGRDYIARIAGGYENKRHGPVILPQSLYDRAKAEGVDLNGYIRQERIPMIKSINHNKPKLTLRCNRS